MGGIPLIEKLCATGDNGEVDKELMLSKLLVGLHRRVKLLAGLQRRKSLVEAKDKPPDQAGTGAVEAEEEEEEEGGGKLPTGWPAMGDGGGEGERQNG